MSVLSDALQAVYDRKHDVLYVSIGDPRPGYGETDDEISSLILRYDMSDKIIGVTVLDFSKQDREKLRERVPFPIDFDSLDI